MKILKFIGWLLTILIVLLVVLYLTAGFWLRSVVSTLVPQMTKTPASLEQADISLFQGRILLKEFKIGNPAGFIDPNAFEIGEIAVRFEPTSLLTNKIIINEITINGTKVGAELAKSGKINLMVLNENIQEFLGNPTTAASATSNKELPQQNKKQASAKAVVVKDLKITNSLLDFTFLSQKTQVKLPDIHEKNVGEKKKETLFDLAANVVDQLTTSSLTQISKASQESINKLLGDLANRSKEASGFVKGLQDSFNKMF